MRNQKCDSVPKYYECFLSSKTILNPQNNVLANGFPFGPMVTPGALSICTVRPV